MNLQTPRRDRSYADEEASVPLASARDTSRAPVTPERRERMSPEQEILGRNRSRGSPDFGGGVAFYSDDAN